MVEDLLPEGTEPLVATLVEHFAGEGAKREVEMLTSARVSLVHMKNDPVLGETYCLCVRVPARIYEEIAGRQDYYEGRLLKAAQGLLPRYVRDKLEKLALAPILTADRTWRSKARAWLKDENDERPGRWQVRDRTPPAPSRPNLSSVDIHVSSEILKPDKI